MQQQQHQEERKRRVSATWAKSGLSLNIHSVVGGSERPPRFLLTFFHFIYFLRSFFLFILRPASLRRGALFTGRRRGKIRPPSLDTTCTNLQQDSYPSLHDDYDTTVVERPIPPPLPGNPKRVAHSFEQQFHINEPTESPFVFLFLPEQNISFFSTSSPFNPGNNRLQTKTIR